MPIFFGKPVESDLPEIEALLRITYIDTFRKNNISSIFEINEEIQSKLDNIRKDIIEHDSNFYFLIAKLENQIIGICAYFPVSEIIRTNIAKIDKNELEIGCTYIHPDYQKMGIGKKLFDMIIDEMKKNGKSQYYLCSGFESSQQYWKSKLGNPIYIVENIWGIGKHEIIWKVDIR